MTVSTLPEYWKWNCSGCGTKGKLAVEDPGPYIIDLAINEHKIKSPRCPDSYRLHLKAVK